MVDKGLHPFHTWYLLFPYKTALLGWCCWILGHRHTLFHKREWVTSKSSHFGCRKFASWNTNLLWKVDFSFYTQREIMHFQSTSKNVSSWVSPLSSRMWDIKWHFVQSSPSICFRKAQQDRPALHLMGICNGEFQRVTWDTSLPLGVSFMPVQGGPPNP